VSAGPVSVALTGFSSGIPGQFVARPVPFINRGMRPIEEEKANGPRRLEAEKPRSGESGLCKDRSFPSADNGQNAFSRSSPEALENHLSKLN